ncbi:TonB-dependent vitamin B12 receptor [Kaarinaea lacus]
MKKFYMSVVFLFGVQSYFNQASSADVSLSSNESDPVIVTATRTARTAEETLSSVTVITQEDIERQQAASIQEVLRSVAGLSVANSGGEGKLSSIFIRGTESDHLLVIVDGVKIGSASAGLSAFQLIPVELIERIEIVRGPRSSLYGSEAIGGVIQLFTKKGKGELRPTVSLSAGSFDSYKALAGLSGGDDKTWYNVSVSSYDTQGFNACDGEPLVGGCYATEPDDDSYRYTAGSIALGHQLTKRTKVDLNWLRSNGNVKYDGFYNQSETVQQVAGARFSHEVSSSWNLSLLVGQSKDESDDFSNGTFLSKVNTKRDTASIQSDLLMNNESELTLGLDYQDDQLDSNTAYNETTRTNKGLFAQYIHDLGKQNLQVSARRDDNEQFGNHSTGSIAWGMDVGKRKRVIVSYGTAFKAPTFNDLYYPFAGNPDLKPEESSSVELGVSGRESWGKWSVNLYRTDIDELIIYDVVASMPENIEKASIKGIEFIVQSRIMHWDTQLNLSVLDPKNRSNNGNNGNVLPRRAKETAQLVVSRNFGKYNLGGTVIADGNRYDNAANTVKLASYYTVDIYGSYQAATDWRVGASVKNIFDEDYQTVAYYNTPGRYYLLTVSYQPSKL